MAAPRLAPIAAFAGGGICLELKRRRWGG